MWRDLIPLPRRDRGQTPLLPEAGAAGTPLTIVIAVLAFMASVAFASYFMVSRAVADWTGDLAGTITVQVKGTSSERIDVEALKVTRILNASDGVENVREISREERQKLLEPWLGRDNLNSDIPIPALVTADISVELRRNLEPLRDSIRNASPFASVDDHGQWNTRLVEAATQTKIIAFCIFLMILSASSAIIIFATRAGLAANRSIVEVMHLVGATDGFIAQEIQRRYFTLSLRGGIIGAVLASLLLFISASFSTSSSGMFLPNLVADPLMLIWLSLVPVILCGVASLSARFTVGRVLSEQMH